MRHRRPAVPHAGQEMIRLPFIVRLDRSLSSAKSTAASQLPDTERATGRTRYHRHTRFERRSLSPLTSCVCLRCGGAQIGALSTTKKARGPDVPRGQSVTVHVIDSYGGRNIGAPQAWAASHAIRDCCGDGAVSRVRRPCVRAWIEAPSLWRSVQPWHRH